MTKKSNGLSNIRSNDLLCGRSKRFVATGNTWPHREKFISWAWHWDFIKKVKIDCAECPINILILRQVGKDLGSARWKEKE